MGNRKDRNEFKDTPRTVRWAGILYSLAVAILSLPLALIRLLDHYYWVNKDVYFKLLNCADFDDMEHWQLEDELREHGIVIVRGDYGTPTDVVILQVLQKSLLQNPDITIRMIIGILARHRLVAVCVGNNFLLSIWGKRMW